MIQGYDIEVLTPPCDPGSARLVAKAHLGGDISPVLPYLNATLPGADYSPEAPALTWEHDGRAVAFHPVEIAVADIADRAEAAAVLRDLVAVVNETWRRRSEIVPSVAARQRATPMAVYRLLPGTNCRECGMPGCWHFALRLVTGEMGTDRCPPLAAPEAAGRLAALQSLGVKGDD